MPASTGIASRLLKEANRLHLDNLERKKGHGMTFYLVDHSITLNGQDCYSSWVSSDHITINFRHNVHQGFIVGAYLVPV
ncbi:hypothetical protein RRG08_029155 [Elysia crispata]|uniref:Uncharacterized protein n=1 Tax=Elysia crispata TaxID=231223 RepID=A0AAE1CTE3_9GAST|nr:hypothetical protein RRG08_029155 [Elysia crispata]